MTREGKPHRGRAAERSLPPWPRWLLGALAAACCGLGGCSNFWEEVTSRDFKVDNLFHTPDPMVVLRDSKSGKLRADALRSLKEPLANGGDEKDQEVVLNILNAAAATEEHAVCRMAAIDALRHFKDPRAVKGLDDAYYRAGAYPPETASVIRCLALQGLGQTGNPEAIKTLLRALREPAVEGADPERQLKLDERIAAARALARFSQPQATQALVEVLRGEQDVALRNRAHESLQVATGQHLPPDAQAWSDFVNRTGDSAVVHQPTVGEKFRRVVGWGSD